jgi:hypothetical protein
MANNTLAETSAPSLILFAFLESPAVFINRIIALRSQHYQDYARTLAAYLVK